MTLSMLFARERGLAFGTAPLKAAFFNPGSLSLIHALSSTIETTSVDSVDTR